jgi:hypothetical protein
MRELAARLPQGAVCCGEWDRVLSPACTTIHGVTGVFLDPPYTEGNFQYSAGGCGGEIADAVREWAIANGNNPDLRIALCGYEGEHILPASWECVPWKARKGYQTTDSAVADRGRERIWFSPHCLRPQESLFRSLEEEPAPHSEEWMAALGARDLIVEEAFSGSPDEPGERT